MIRLFHGTQAKMAQSIIDFGVDSVKASECGSSGDFYTTVEPEVAAWYSKLSIHSPENGAPVIVGFDLEKQTIDDWLQRSPTWIIDHFLDGIYQFLPRSHATLNCKMTNVTLTYVDQGP